MSTSLKPEYWGTPKVMSYFQNGESTYQQGVNSMLA